jgi:formylglycine-generating enzyme required for sulfatase activity
MTIAEDNRAACGVRRAALAPYSQRSRCCNVPSTPHAAHRTPHLITLVVILALTSCGGSGTGNSDQSLSGAVGSTRAHYQIIELASGRVTAAGTVADLTTNPAYRTTHVVFRLVEVGSGTIGSTSSQLGAAVDPVASVVGASSFYLAVFETTQAQWQELAGNTPWTLLSSNDGSDDVRVGATMPAVGVSHDLATTALTTYRTTRGIVLALPSDTQWELACRAGGAGTWAWGDTAVPATVSAAAVVWETKGTTRGARVVGERSASTLGFFDLHGNVWELTSAGTLRGGSWNDPLATARAAHRATIDPATRHLLVGARLVYVP